MHHRKTVFSGLTRPVFITLILLTLSLAAGHGQNGLRTVLINPADLAALKKKYLDLDPRHRKPVEKVISDADKALDGPVYSVTSKKIVPPSGDKHDFISTGKYWWPDKSKKDGIPYIRRDGEINPEYYDYTDKTYINKMIKSTAALAFAQYFTGDDDYGEKGRELVKTWFLDPKTRMNPNLNFAQGIPGGDPGRNWGIMDSHNFPLLLDAVMILHHQGHLSDDEYHELKQWFTDFKTWLTKSPLGIQEANVSNNHRSWYDTQLLSIAVFVQDHKTIDELINVRIPANIDKQFNDNGEQPFELERSTSLQYSIFNLQAHFWTLLMVQNLNKDRSIKITNEKWEKIRSTLETATDLLIPYIYGEKNWPHPQIKPLNERQSYDTFQLAWYFYGDKKYHKILKFMKRSEYEKNRCRVYFPIIK